MDNSNYAPGPQRTNSETPVMKSRTSAIFGELQVYAPGAPGVSCRRMNYFVAYLLVSRDLNKPEPDLDAWMQVYYITIKDKERREMLGFLLSLLLPVKLAAAAVVIYLLLRIMFG